MIEIVNQRIFVNGKETVDPILIGYAVIDFAENKRNGVVTLSTKEEDSIKKSNSDRKPN